MKTEVYSWRLDPELKSSLEHAASSRGRSVAGLLDEIVRAWVEREVATEEGEALQRRLHAQARKAFGSLEHGDTRLAEEAQERVRRKLRKQHAAGGSG